jgi:hypothetical protein
MHMIDTGRQEIWKEEDKKQQEERTMQCESGPEKW